MDPRPVTTLQADSYNSLSFLMFQVLAIDFCKLVFPFLPVSCTKDKLQNWNQSSRKR